MDVILCLSLNSYDRTIRVSHIIKSLQLQLRRAKEKINTSHTDTKSAEPKSPSPEALTLWTTDTTTDVIDVTSSLQLFSFNQDFSASLAHQAFFSSMKFCDSMNEHAPFNVFACLAQKVCFSLLRSFFFCATLILQSWG